MFSSKQKVKNKSDSATKKSKNSTSIINSWMYEDYKIKRKQKKAIPPTPPPEQEVKKEQPVVSKSEPRVETSILKNRIAEKIKNYNQQKS